MKIIDKIFKHKYPLESAGRRMIKNVPLVLPEEKILDIRKKLFEKAQDFETLNYIYVVDKRGKLLGIFSLKDIFQKSEQITAQEIMEKEIISAEPYLDQEKVAFLALKHNLKSIPVVDKENSFLGIVPSDAILEILHSENIEDILRFAGISKYNSFAAKIFQASPFVLIKLRLPWLIFGLFGGLLAARMIGFFEGHLKSHFILAAFIPLIVYMADAVGVQAQTLFIRSLTLNSHLSVRKYFLKETKTSLALALILGGLLFLISFFWFGFLNIGIVLGFSLFLTVICSSFIAILIPWALQSMKKDPAIGSGPFATIVRDILSLVLYFSIAFLLLNFFKI